MKKIKFTFVAILLCIATTHAQYYHGYGRDLDDIGYSITRSLDDGSFMTAGTTISPDGIFGNNDATFLSIQPDGSFFSFIYGGSQYDDFRSVTPVFYEDLRFCLLGTTYSFGTNGDNYLVGIGKDGSEIFSRAFGNYQLDQGNCVKMIRHPSPTNNAGLALIGTTKSLYPGSTAISIIITDLKGDWLDSKVIYWGTSNLEGLWIEQSPVDQTFFITGSYTHGGQKCIFAARLTPDLETLIWKRFYYVPMSEGRCLKEDTDGNIIIVGNLKADGFIMKVDRNNGNKLWFRSITASGYNITKVNNLYIQKNSGVNEKLYVMCGEALGIGNSVALLFATNSSLSVPTFMRKFGTDSNNAAYEIYPGPNKGFIFTGFVGNIGHPKEICNVVTDNHGDAHSTCEFTEFISLEHQDFWVGYAGKIDAFPVDRWEFSSPNLKIDIKKYKCNPADDNTIMGVKNDEINGNSFKVYPSPASDQITVEFNEQYTTGELIIIDITGKIVYKENIENCLSKNISVEHLSKGLYILKVSKDQKYETSKFMKD